MFVLKGDRPEGGGRDDFVLRSSLRLLRTCVGSGTESEEKISDVQCTENHRTVMLQIIPSATAISVMERVVLPFMGIILAGDFSGDENTPSIFSTPKLSLVFSGKVRPVLLYSC
jgi:hypothetical protein